MCWAGTIDLKKSMAPWQKSGTEKHSERVLWLRTTTSLLVPDFLPGNRGFIYEQKLWILKKQGHLGQLS